MRTVAMIPARMGSQRVPRKNLRYLGPRPLLAWSVETALASGLFDEVFVNTESDEIASLAASLGAKVYQRTNDLAAPDVTSEQFVADFLRAVPCDVVVQVTPTSPFLESADIGAALDLISGGADTVVSVCRIQAECLSIDAGGETRPINFARDVAMVPSQALQPVFALCNGVFAWRAAAFLARSAETNAACFGGRLGVLELSGDAALDIDTEREFRLAEQIERARREQSVPLYWTPTAQIEVGDDSGVLTRDGVQCHDLSAAQAGRVVSLPAVVSRLQSEGGNALRVSESPTLSATVISQSPGDGNRMHYHVDVDETWIILQGEFLFAVGDQPPLRARTGDLLTIPRGTWHQALVVGDGRASRLAISRSGSAHIYRE